MNETKKEFVVCGGSGCVNLLGCVSIDGIKKICDKDCGKEQFFQCTFEKDEIEAGDGDGSCKIKVQEGSKCKHCPDPNVVIEDLGPIAVLSS